MREPGLAKPQPWHRRDPVRWRHEKQALTAAGLEFEVVYRKEVRLNVRVPVAEFGTAKLQIRFPVTYPYFPPTVLDVDGVLAGIRHRSSWDTLCLLHEDAWHQQMTVADLLTQQVPRLLEANRTGDPFPIAPGAGGLEVAGTESVHHSITASAPVIVVPDLDVPQDATEGALMTRLEWTSQGPGTGVVEAVWGDGFELHHDLSEASLASFALRIAGRWTRDPDFDVRESPVDTWKRVSARLGSLESSGEHVIPPRGAQLLALLVPDEVGFRTRGESWVFLLKSRRQRRPGHTIEFLATQYLSRRMLSARTPVAAKLKDRSVVVVGLGSIGMPLLQDLAQSGVGRLTALDRKHVSVETGTRQTGSLGWAGEAKATLAYSAVSKLAPFCDIDAIRINVEDLWNPPASAESAMTLRTLRHRLASDCLVIDATANLAATRLMSDYRAALGRPLLVVSATGGGWGGVAALMTQDSGCWTCIEYARVDNSLPVPPASPDSWVSPPRCAEPTFTGERSAVQQVALHGSAMAIAYLTGTPMEHNYYAASMRTSDGLPAPINWTGADIAPHPSCPQHALKASSSLTG